MMIHMFVHSEINRRLKDMKSKKRSHDDDL